MSVRDLFNMYSKDSSRTPTAAPQVKLYASQQLDETIYLQDKDVNWVRQGVEGTVVETDVVENLVEMEESD
ncbi:PREDICTED: CICLE_v10006474mg partial [Prunus dulcis]|uniref:PREDICTED: CICLE_v10006474mg partial n=1 Tax=Prunus dulcis TaxID=3755 RepID=A0A5E4FAT7_PRUDU|nr:PREDICTED: CICLE_v10006474mg partial [Prunus dulcis]